MPSRSRFHNPPIVLTPHQRLELLRIASSPREHEPLRIRALIVLRWAEGATGAQSAALLGTSRRTVSKWRTRFREYGVDGLHDRPRCGAPRRVPAIKIAELERLRQSPPPQGKPRWTTRMLAQHTGLSQSTVARMVAKQAL